MERFNGKLRETLPDRELFYTLLEAQVIVEPWRWHCNQARPHSELAYRLPAPATGLAEPALATAGGLNANWHRH